MFFAPTVRARSYSPRAFDRSFERFFNDAFAAAAPAQRGLQFEQDDKSWTLSLDVPGLSREELSIGIEGAVVRIESKAEAKLENGVLTLKLAKKVPVSNVAQLAIN